jgi:hypothetical protein
MLSNLSSGRTANRNGRTLENTVIHTFEDKGFQAISYSDWVRRPDKYGDDLLLKNAPYTTIYGQPGKTEFLARSRRYGLTIRIECKWQQTSGSVDEKFPYVYLNAIEAMPESHVMILVDGGGAKRSAVNWLKTAASQRLYQKPGLAKRIEVWTLSEFLAWANRTLI